MDYAQLLDKVNAWARTVDGKYVDLDGFPPNDPYQCHDLWLSYMKYITGLDIWHGHAPGPGWTDNVWLSFPKHRPELKKHFTKVKGHKLRAGDVVFWPYGDPQYRLSHVAIAVTSPNKHGYIKCVTQNWGGKRTAIKWIPVSRALGALRPIVKSSSPKSKKGLKVIHYRRRDKTANGKGRRIIKPGTGLYLNQSNANPSKATNIVGGVGPYVQTVHVYGTGKPGDLVTVSLLFSDTRHKPAKRSWHFKQTFAVKDDGTFEENVTFQRPVQAGYAVYAHVAGRKKNKGDIVLTLLDTDTYLIK